MLSIDTAVAPEGFVRLTLAGDLTEDSDLPRVHQHKGKEIHFDLAGIRRINSLGVRDWVTLVATLDASGATLTFERCAVPFVSQVNMISNFCGKGTIRSFQIPYTCDECGHESEILWEVTTERRPIPETIPCEACRATMQMDELPDVYFTFLK